MPDALAEPLQAWQNFYLLVGGASATLVGLIFVAIWLGAYIQTEQPTAGLDAFVTPTLMHFVYILGVSAVVVIPTVTRTFLSILLLVVGLASLGATLRGVPWMYQQYRQQRIDRTDLVWYLLVPSVSYLIYVGTGVALLKGSRYALNGLATASLLLLLVAIRNAWDTMVWFVMRLRQSSSG